MPELPEVEVIRQFLNNQILHKTIIDVIVHNPKSFQGDPSLIKHQKVESFSRHGKQLSLHLSNNITLLFHFKMTGQLVCVHRKKTILGHPTPTLNNQPLPNKSTRINFKFSDGSTLYFNDQRKFGWVKALTPADLLEYQKTLGKDLLDPSFTPNYFKKQLQKSSRSIKLVLLDQTKFAGIGNIYANDALFLSGIHPQTSANSLTSKVATKLYRHLLDITRESISHGGSTAKDNKYIHPDGSFGSHQYHFRVYQKEGEPCLQCSTCIERIKIGGRSSFFCPSCQRLI